jgi:hypothetical protein
VAGVDPTDTGGLFFRRSGEGRRPLRFRGQPVTGGAARQRADRALAGAILALETLLCLTLFGPQPYFWLWFGSQAQYWTDSPSIGIATTLLGSLASLLATVVIGKRLDEWWKLVRRAAGYDQRRGALERIFAVTVGVAVVIFMFWFLIVEGPNPSVAPQ